MGHSPRVARKRSQILAAALEVFLERGFADATMDEVAQRAGASKVTIYNHFASKERLFTDLAEEQIAATSRLSDDSLHALEHVTTSAELDRELHRFAHQFVTAVLAPHVVAMRRLMIASALQFPALADTWYRQGIEASYDTLERLFADLDARGLLVTPEPRAAAQAFTWLVLSVPLNAAMFRPEHLPSARDLARAADAGVGTFLAAFAVSGPA